MNPTSYRGQTAPFFLEIGLVDFTGAIVHSRMLGTRTRIRETFLDLRPASPAIN
jgi:hypothetical protein